MGEGGRGYGDGEVGSVTHTDLVAVGELEWLGEGIFSMLSFNKVGSRLVLAEN